MPYLIERLHPSNETNRIAVDYFHPLLDLWCEGIETAAQLKTKLDLTVDESAELDTLLALAPEALGGLTGLLLPLAPLENAPRHTWAMTVRSVLVCCEVGYSGYQSVADVRSKLNLPDPEA